MSNRQKFSLKLDDQVVEGRRQFFLDARPEHGISQDLLDEALKQARVGIWRQDPQAGFNLGRKLEGRADEWRIKLGNARVT